MHISEIKTLTDFELNELISRSLNRSVASGVSKPPEKILFAAAREWQNRHPGTLAPCYADLPFPDCYRGPRTVYEWAQA
jgi:hypothetical protein